MSWWHELLSRLPFEWAHFEFMRNALAAVLLAAPLFALLGTLVVSNRMAFFSEALGHASLTGVGLGVLLGLGHPLPALLGFTLLLGWTMVILKRVSRSPSDTIISLCMSFSIALGVVLLSRGGGMARFTHFLVGDPLSMTSSEIGWLGLTTLAVGAIVLVFYNKILLSGLNTSLARSRGVGLLFTQLVFVTATVLAVAMNLGWIGLLLINALLVLPAAAARNVARSVRSYVALSLLVALVSGVAGLLLAFYLETAVSATIALVAIGFFALSLLARPAHPV